MPDIHLSADIKRPPEAVFNLIADIADYHQWLPPSKTYGETVDISDTPVKQGTTYVDKNTSSTLYGDIREYQPPTRIVFHQTTKQPSLEITITYALSPTGQGTHLERTTSITTAGLMRLLQPIVVSRTRQENERTIAVMKAYLEAH